MKSLIFFLVIFSIFAGTLKAEQGLSHELGLSAGSVYLNYKISALTDFGLFYNIYFPKIKDIHFGLAIDKGFGEKDFLLSLLTLFFKFGDHFKFGASAGYYSDSKYYKSQFYDETIRYYGAFFRGSFNFLIHVNKFTISPVLNIDLFRRDYFASVSLNISYPLPN
jgi:hypothetical protein